MRWIKEAWTGLDNTGRAVLVACVAAVLIASMYFGYVAMILGWLG